MSLHHLYLDFKPRNSFCEPDVHKLIEGKTLWGGYSMQDFSDCGALVECYSYADEQSLMQLNGTSQNNSTLKVSIKTVIQVLRKGSLQHVNTPQSVQDATAPMHQSTPISLRTRCQGRIVLHSGEYLLQTQPKFIKTSSDQMRFVRFVWEQKGDFPCKLPGRLVNSCYRCVYVIRYEGESVVIDCKEEDAMTLMMCLECPDDIGGLTITTRNAIINNHLPQAAPSETLADGQPIVADRQGEGASSPSSSRSRLVLEWNHRDELPKISGGVWKVLHGQRGASKAAIECSYGDAAAMVARLSAHKTTHGCLVVTWENLPLHHSNQFSSHTPLKSVHNTNNTSDQIRHLHAPVADPHTSAQNGSQEGICYSVRFAWNTSNAKFTLWLLHHLVSNVVRGGFVFSFKQPVTRTSPAFVECNEDDAVALVARLDGCKRGLGCLTVTREDYPIKQRHHQGLPTFEGGATNPDPTLSLNQSMASCLDGIYSLRVEDMKDV